jgi:molybdopterin converting factor small subunit
MQVRVRLFAMMAEQAGADLISLDVPPGCRAAGIRRELEGRIPHLPWPPGTMLAINQEYAGPDDELKDNDELAIIPPVSGG